MRKWVWSGVALLLLAGAGVYLAADHASRHPDTFIGRCAITATRLTSRFSPVVLVRAAQVLPSGAAPSCNTAANTPCGITATHSELEPIVVSVEPFVNERNLGVTTPTTRVKLTPAFMPYADQETNEVAVTAVTEDVFETSTEVVETDTQTATPPARADELTQVHNVQYPQMYQDPHYHHYPCCPYTGRCPQPYPTQYPVLPRAEDSDTNQNKPEANGAAQTDEVSGSVSN